MRDRSIELISGRQAADYLRISERNLRRLVEAGKLSQVRLGFSPAYQWGEVWRFVGIVSGGRQAAYTVPLLTAEEVAARLPGFGPSVVKRLASRGEMPAHRVGRAWRFAPVEIESWLCGLGQRRTQDDRKISDLATPEPDGP